MMDQRSLRVFLVEDEAILLMQLEALVTAAGHEVVATAMSGEEAIRTAETLDADLAFVDLRLCDGETGFRVGRCLARDAGIPVIFVTANDRRVLGGAERGAEIDGSFGGALGVIAKPYTLHGLQTALAFLEEALIAPPPSSAPPPGLLIAPHVAQRWRRAS
ncbi:response regulator [Methylobacterium segetis]|uniref:response regulator n=1 Tax=Methylobacterium segetis TaxID=2488750 RepID=UPI00104B3283|nr:response regulator [Methylobacterium segetis]